MPIYGTPQKDVIRDTWGGENSRESIWGYAGDDLIYGLSGHDWIDGGAGNDTIYGGQGRDTIAGGDGDDDLTGGSQSDLLLIRGSSGTFRVDLSNSQRQDTGQGRDLITGFEAVRAIGAANFWIRGSAAGLETLEGGSGHDTIISGGGLDVMRGGAGNDLLMITVTSPIPNGWIDGGQGNDTLRGSAGADFISGDALGSIEVIEGMGGNDRLFGGQAGQILRGGAGQDELVANAANQLLDGGPGFDMVSMYGRINLALVGGQVIDGNAGVVLRDIEGAIARSGQDDQMTGNQFANWFISNFGNDTLFGGAGNDTLDGGGDNDLLYGQAGNDRLLAGSGDDRLDGGDGNDQLIAGPGRDRLFGGAGNDTLIGGPGADTMTGGTGADDFVFSARADLGKGVSRDVISDFQRGLDDLDLQTIDANSSAGGDQAFRWSGGAGAHAVWQLQANGLTIVRGDWNGDAVFDFEIALNGLGRVTAADFLL